MSQRLPFRKQKNRVATPQPRKGYLQKRLTEYQKAISRKSHTPSKRG